MHRYKFLGDTFLIQMFTAELKKVKMRRGWIVPIPLSENRLSERKFNQAEEIARRMNGKVISALKRDEGAALSSKSRKERLNRKNPFHVTKEVSGKRILLVDDVYTTGITLRQAMVRLKEAGASEISAVTLFRSI
ncbi:ComF family protein [uncultured Exiguobacterium sp.]|uniref:ComF family protein n=1 Tax=uncultured Exiguobacterium sp. TaxID=202669 RepID=UPI0025EC4504|nr:phosphoribosyltransferase family protein [uncultured Exiguobacterium sp.]